MNPFSIRAHEPPAIVFVNPRAGRGRAKRCLSAVKRIFAERSFPAEFVLTNTAEELESHARSAIQSGTRVLLAMGGDGTLQALANAARGSDVVLGIVPAGGGNDFAAALGLPKNPIAAVKAVLSGKPRSVDLLCARTAEGRQRLFVGGGGLGLDADSARYSVGAYAHLPGRFRYIASALRALLEFKSLRIRVEFPSTGIPAIETRALLAAALNTPSYGAGLRLAPEAQIDDGLLTMLLVPNLTAAQVLAVLPGLIGRGELPPSYLTRITAARVRFSADRECLFHGDGEILGPAPVEIEVLPKTMRILAPMS